MKGFYADVVDRDATDLITVPTRSPQIETRAKVTPVEEVISTLEMSPAGKVVGVRMTAVCPGMAGQLPTTSVRPERPCATAR